MCVTYHSHYLCVQRCSRPSHEVAMRVNEHFLPHSVQGDQHLSVWCTFNWYKLHYPVSCFSVTVSSPPSTGTELVHHTHTNTRTACCMRWLRWVTRAEMNETQKWSESSAEDDPQISLSLSVSVTLCTYHTHSHTHYLTRACSGSSLGRYVSTRARRNGCKSPESFSTATRVALWLTNIQILYL